MFIFALSQGGCTDKKELKKLVTSKSCAYAEFRDRARFYAIRQVSES